MNIEEIRTWWNSLNEEEQIKLGIKYFPGTYVYGVEPSVSQLERIYEQELHPEGLE